VVHAIEESHLIVASGAFLVLARRMLTRRPDPRVQACPAPPFLYAHRTMAKGNGRASMAWLNLQLDPRNTMLVIKLLQFFSYSGDIIGNGRNPLRRLGSAI